MAPSKKRGGRRYRPCAFTEQGIAMLSGVLRSKRAIQLNILIMRAFVQLRQMISTNDEMVEKFDSLEKKYDARFRVVFEFGNFVIGGGQVFETHITMSI